MNDLRSFASATSSYLYPIVNINAQLMRVSSTHSLLEEIVPEKIQRQLNGSYRSTIQITSLALPVMDVLLLHVFK
jgi:hypothetical protein